MFGLYSLDRGNSRLLVGNVQLQFAAGFAQLGEAVGMAGRGPHREARGPQCQRRRAPNARGTPGNEDRAGARNRVIDVMVIHNVYCAHIAADCESAAGTRHGVP